MSSILNKHLMGSKLKTEAGINFLRIYLLHYILMVFDSYRIMRRSSDHWREIFFSTFFILSVLTFMLAVHKFLVK